MDKRKQMIYQKTEFNKSLICMLNTVFKCSKCKKNNSIIISPDKKYQNCLFCGNPNPPFPPLRKVEPNPL